MWPAQSWLLSVVMGSPLLCILKARQLGITWLAVAYGVWLVAFHANRYVLLFSHRQEDAKELLGRAVFVLEHLPVWLQPAVATDNALMMETERGSRLQAFPTTGSEGRTYAASLAIVDEAGTVRNLLDLITALEPVVEGGGRLVVLGTARGIGGFWTLVQRIRTGILGGWRFVFLPWMSRPDRGAGWREEQRERFTEEWRLYQEFPESVEEAFQLGGRPRFDRDRVKRLSLRVRRPLPAAAVLAREEMPEEPLLRQALVDGQLRIWRRPKGGHVYILPADTAEGLPGLDQCAAMVLDARTGVAVAELAGWWEDHKFARILAALGVWYHRALLAVERNNTGVSVLNSLVNVERYWNLYQASEPGQSPGGRFGWITTTRTKPLMYDALDRALHDDGRRWYSEQLLMEALLCQRRDDGTVGAPEVEGAHDDLLTAYCIGEAVWQEQGYMYRGGA